MSILWDAEWTGFSVRWLAADAFGVSVTPAATTSPSVAGTAAIVITGGAGSIAVTPANTTSASLASVPGIAITTPLPWRPSAPVGAHRRAQLATRRARLSTRTR